MSLRYQPIEVILTLEQLTELCAEWQERLRLQDWTIIVEMNTIHQMNPSVTGSINLHQASKLAKLRILDAKDHDPAFWTPFDMEQTLVHELLHIHLDLWPVKKETALDDAREFAIESMSQALVQMKRERLLDAEVSQKTSGD